MENQNQKQIPLTNLLQRLKNEQAELLATIGGKKIPISYSNGIALNAENGMSAEDAKTILKNKRAYIKESSRFEKDNTRIALSRRVFTNLLATSSLMKEHDLFLFQNISKDAMAKLPFSQRIKLNKATEDRNDLGWIIWGVTCCLICMSSILLTGFWTGFNFSNYPVKVLWGVSVSILFLVSAVFSYKALKRHQKEVLEAIRFLWDITGTVIFYYGHDVAKDYDRNGAISKSNEDIGDSLDMRMEFKNAYDYSSVVMDALNFDGKVGLLIRKNGETHINWSNNAITYHGIIVPVIILEETVVFLKKYTDNMMKVIEVNPDIDIIPKNGFNLFL